MKQVLTRKSKQIARKEAAIMTKALAPYGAKRECSRVTGLSVQTIRNILEARSGLEAHVTKLQQYFTAVVCNCAKAAA